MKRTAIFSLFLTACVLPLAACQTGDYPDVPALDAQAFNGSELAEDLSGFVRTPGGESVRLVYPAEDATVQDTEVIIQGGEKIFQVLSKGKAFQGFMDNDCEWIALVRTYGEPIQVMEAGAEQPEMVSNVLVILIDVKALLEDQRESENISVLPADEILVPLHGEDVASGIRRVFGYALVRVDELELTRRAKSASASRVYRPVASPGA